MTRVSVQFDSNNNLLEQSNRFIPCIYIKDNHIVNSGGIHDIRISLAESESHLLSGLDSVNIIWIQIDDEIQDWLVIREKLTLLLKKIFSIKREAVIGFASKTLLFPAFKEGHLSHEFLSGILIELKYFGIPWISVPLSYKHADIFLEKNFYFGGVSYSPFVAFKNAGFNIQVEILNNIHNLNNETIFKAIGTSDPAECYFNYISFFEEIDAIYFGEETGNYFQFYNKVHG